MPKPAASLQSKLNAFSEEFAKEAIVKDQNKLICKHCVVDIVPKRSQINQHIETGKHKKNRNLKMKQKLLSETNSQQSFNSDLCKAFIAANIPLYKLKHPQLRNFLEQYTGRYLPEESTLRTNYLNDVFEDTLNEIRQKIRDGPIWLSVDEFTDVDGRYIANVIVGKLSPDEPTESFLLYSEHIPKTNHQTIAKVVHNSLSVLWPKGVLFDRVLVIVSDAAAYMIKAVTCLTALFPKLIHVTCLAHALHRVCEAIRFRFDETNSLISLTKNIFKKAPSRIEKFKEMCPNIPLPLSPVCTRWGTWLLAAEYYAQHFVAIKAVIIDMDDDSEAIKKAKEVYQKPEVFQQLTSLRKNYTFIAHSITKLENSGVELTESLKIIKNVTERLQNVPDKFVKEKLACVLSKNVGLLALSSTLMTDVSKPKKAKYSQFDGFSPAELASLKFAPIVSCDVERSFSMFKNILADNRRRFTFEHLHKHIIIGCNNTRRCDPLEKKEQREN